MATKPDPTTRAKSALAQLIKAEGAHAVTVANVRELARTDQRVAAKVVRDWRNSLLTGETPSEVDPRETTAFEALRDAIREVAGEGYAKQIKELSTGLRLASEEAETARSEVKDLQAQLSDSARNVRDLQAEIQRLSGQLENAHSTLEAEQARAQAIEADLRNQVETARIEATEAKTELRIYKQQAKPKAKTRKQTVRKKPVN